MFYTNLYGAFEDDQILNHPTKTFYITPTSYIISLEPFILKLTRSAIKLENSVESQNQTSNSNPDYKLQTKNSKLYTISISDSIPVSGRIVKPFTW
jgi:hypothetical protein